MKKIISFAALALLATSCSTTIDFKVPGNRFHSPEVSGDTLNGKFQIGYGKAHKFETATLYGDSIFSSSATKDTEGRIKEGHALSYDVNVGIIEQLDFYSRATADSAHMYGLKYQILGDASSEGHKLTIMASYGTGSDTESSQRVVGDSSERIYKADLDIKAWEAELIYGYRFHKNILGYVNLNYASFDTETFLSSPSFEDEKIIVTARTVGFLVGVDLMSDNKKTGFVLESGVVKSEWDSRFDDTNIPVGINVYWNWH